MYVCMCVYVRTYVCMYICIHVPHACIHAYTMVDPNLVRMPELPS